MSKKAAMHSKMAKAAGWAPGPWHDEPDKLEFKAHGMHCMIARANAGHLCGYVAVTTGHPLHPHSKRGKFAHRILVDALKQRMAELRDKRSTEAIMVRCLVKYSKISVVPDENLPSHEGINYCFMDRKQRYWFGFDCGHLGDVCPRDVDSQFPPQPTDVYRDIVYVKRVCKKLACKLAKIGGAL